LGLLAASIVAIIVGSVQLTSNIFDFGIFDTNDAKVATNLGTDTDAGAGQNAETTASVVDNQKDVPARADADITATLLAPPTLPSLTPATPTPKVGTMGVPPSVNSREIDNGTAPTSNLPLPVLNPPLLSAPVVALPSGSKGDVTGSVARPPSDVAINRPPAPAASPQVAEGLPAAIGGARLRNAAAAGDPAAAYEIAMRYMEGRGVPANLEEAARWYERAASKGLGPAQFRYASMLEKGQGVRKDLGAARKLYIAAATKGHAKAMHNLAVLYAEGAEGKPEYANAAQWFRRAAEHGVADSQYNLGVLTARGLGTDKNVAESYKWFALAASQGDKDAARKRDDVASNLDPQALATAQEAVKSFTAQAQPSVATMVPEPSGGWDRTTPPPPHEKPRAGGPLSISANGAGKL
jgi:localization factor PodJL